MLFYGPEISRLRLVRGKTDAVMRIGDRVSLKEGVACPVTKHGTSSGPSGVIEVRLCKVKVRPECATINEPKLTWAQETITTVKVLWQDGTTEQLKATELMPYLTVDEYDVWYVLI
jgi:ubiquitin-conjugating enzyme E2 O